MSLQTEISERRGALVRLVALYRNARQPIRQLTKTITVLGRDEACDIILASRSVGPVHAAIVRSANTAYVCDLGAESGSIIDERRVRWSRLSDGQELVLGRFRFRIELDEPESGVGEDLPPFKLMAQHTGDVVSSSDPVLLVGRDACCDLVLDAPQVAPCHCLVAWTQAGPAVRDLGGDGVETVELIFCVTLGHCRVRGRGRRPQAGDRPQPLAAHASRDDIRGISGCTGDDVV